MIETEVARGKRFNYRPSDLEKGDFKKKHVPPKTKDMH